MKILSLTAGLSYLYTDPQTHRLWHFQKNMPKDISDSMAVTLLASGRFTELPDDHAYGELTGVTYSARFSGSIGDAVTIANFKFYCHNF